jgi:hypothetical protein
MRMNLCASGGSGLPTIGFRTSVGFGLVRCVSLVQSVQSRVASAGRDNQCTVSRVGGLLYDLGTTNEREVP